VAGKRFRQVTARVKEMKILRSEDTCTIRPLPSESPPRPSDTMLAALCAFWTKTHSQFPNVVSHASFPQLCRIKRNRTSMILLLTVQIQSLYVYAQGDCADGTSRRRVCEAVRNEAMLMDSPLQWRSGGLSMSISTWLTSRKGKHKESSAFRRFRWSRSSPGSS